MTKKKESAWGIFKDILLAITVIMAGGLAISLIIFYLTKDAEAAELKMFPDYPTAWIGAEYDFSNEPVTCADDGYGWNGNVGIRQPVMDYGALRMNGVVQHHSCAFSSDSTDYNAVGLNLEFYFGRVFK